MYNVVYNYTKMENNDKKQLELKWKSLTQRNYKKPTDCRSLEQIRNHIRELCLLIEESKRKYDYVPDTAYHLLAQYNYRQNTLLYKDFIALY